MKKACVHNWNVICIFVAKWKGEWQININKLSFNFFFLPFLFVRIIYFMCRPTDKKALNRKFSFIFFSSQFFLSNPKTWKLINCGIFHSNKIIGENCINRNRIEECGLLMEWSIDYNQLNSIQFDGFCEVYDCRHAQA
jgi:hypothetical protein